MLKKKMIEMQSVKDLQLKISRSHTDFLIKVNSDFVSNITASVLVH